MREAHRRLPLRTHTLYIRRASTADPLIARCVVSPPLKDSSGWMGTSGGKGSLSLALGSSPRRALRAGATRPRAYVIVRQCDVLSLPQTETGHDTYPRIRPVQPNWNADERLHADRLIHQDPNP